MNPFTHFANPNRFYKLAQVLLPWVAAAAILTTSAALIWGLFFAPFDYQQGGSVRMLYIHVPAAYMAMAIYAAMGICSAVYLIWRHTLAHVIAAASAPIGAVFALITLITGSLWGKPMWGAWWVWDARLTSMLILFFLYIGYIVIEDSFQDEERGRFSSAMLAIIGCVNLPIIKFSVDWWNTLHQPASLLRWEGPAIHASMLWPLLLAIFGFKLIYLALLLARAQHKILLYKIRRLQYADF
jgi:heme exporter protein C